MLQVALLQSSFEQVARNKEDFAAVFYQRLFSQFPQTQYLFVHTDMKRQQNALMAALAMVISSLKNAELEKLTSALKELGQRHASFGVRPEHYQMVAVALLETFALFLGSAWTPQLKDAWTEAYETVVGLMLPPAAPKERKRLRFITRLIPLVNKR
jgi:hemoglobin-like flavoprotein